MVKWLYVFVCDNAGSGPISLRAELLSSRVHSCILNNALWVRKQNVSKCVIVLNANVMSQDELTLPECTLYSQQHCKLLYSIGYRMNISKLRVQVRNLNALFYSRPLRQNKNKFAIDINAHFPILRLF